MKKVLFVLIVAVVFVSAQVWAFQGNPMFGVKGGINIAGTHGKDSEAEGDTNSSRIAGVFGGFVEYPIGPTLSFQGEILYSMKGDKATWKEGDEEVEGTMKLAYLEIPMLLKANLPMGDKMRPQVYAGPAIAFKMSAKHETEGGSYSGTEDLKDVIKGTDFGLVMGAGVGFPMGARTISLEARYDLGLTNIVKKQAGMDKEPEVKNNAISILLGIGF